MDQRRRDDRPLADEKGRSLEDRAREKGEEIKEDFKGCARRTEGELCGDEGLKREHDKSTLEKMGEQVKGAYETVCNKVTEGARNIGLTNREPDRE